MPAFAISTQAKIARMEIADAKANLESARTNYDAEVKIYDECETMLMDALLNHKTTPMQRFLELRESKRIQARIVRDAFGLLSRAMSRLDDAETNYDLLVAIHS
jgi:hypothetical protein